MTVVESESTKLAKKPSSLTRYASGIAAAVVALSAGLVLLGWTIQSDRLTSLIPGLVAMSPVTAILFLLTALGIALHLAPTSRAKQAALRLIRIGIGASILIAGIAVALGSSFHLQLNFDRLLFTDALGLGENPIALNTALYFALIGLALVALEIDRCPEWISQGLEAIVLSGAMMSLLGHSYGAKNVYGIANHIPIALNTAVLFMLAAVGLLCVRGNRGVLTILAGSDLGSAMARRLLPTAVIVPCILGLLRLLGQQAGWYGTEFGAALMVLATVVLLIAATLFTATALNRTDAERRQATETVRRAADEIRDLYDHAPCGYHSLNENGLIISINNTLLRWLGYERGEIEGKLHFGELLHSASQEAFDKVHSVLKATGQMGSAEFELIRKDRSILPVILNVCPILNANGEHVGSRCSLFDATERRQAERSIRVLNESLEQRVQDRTSELAEANRELEQKNQENEMFVYSVSHDLRSPLVNLQGFSKELNLVAEELRTVLANEAVPDAVRKEASALLDNDVQQSLRFIQTAVTRLGNIIDALLRLSRVGRVDYQLAHIDVQALVTRVVESMGSALYDAGIAVNIQTLPACYGDSTALEQLFANLIGNAIKYRDPSRPGTIDIGAEADHGGPATALQTYYIRDNGLGIPAPHQERIFQAFKRAHPHVAPGDGMGLAIVRRTVERHGGNVWVESREGIGSTFFIALPVQASRRTAEPRGSASLEGEAEHGSGTVGDLVGGRR